MFLKSCNINKTDRLNRAIIGMIVVIAALIGMGRGFFVTVGLLLIIEGLIGWCSIPYLMAKMKRY